MAKRKTGQENIPHKQKQTFKKTTIEKYAPATAASTENGEQPNVKVEAVCRASFRWPHPWHNLFLALLLCVVAWSYSNTFNSPFLLDDIGYILSHKPIKISELSISSLINAGFGEGLNKDASFGEGINRSRWLVNISFALNYYFTGTAKYGFHATNLAIHLCCILVVYLLTVTTLTLPRLGYSRQQAMLIGLLAAGIWGANPMQTNAVSYIYQRITSMATLFYLASLLCYVQARIAGKRRTLLFAASFVLGILALGCKEISVMLPFSILAYEMYFLRESKEGRFDKKILGISILLIAIPVLIAISSTGTNLFFWMTDEYKRYDFTLGERLLTEPRVLIYYLSLFFLPLPSRLNLRHDFPLSHGLFDPWQTCLALVALLALAAAGAYSFKRHRLFSFAVFWYFANLIIESSFIALDIIFEHRFYLPSVFLCIFLAAAIFSLLRAKTLPYLVTAAILVVTLSGLTWQRNKAFASAVTFWSDVAQKSPRLPKAYQELSFALRAEGKAQEARENLLKAFELNPSEPLPAYNLAKLYCDDNRPSAALEVLNKSLPPYNSMNSQSQMTKLVVNNIKLRGDLYRDAEKYAEAKKDYELYLKFIPTDSFVQINLSITQRETGEIQKALKTLTDLPEAQKKSAAFYLNLGQAYHADGQVDLAMQSYQQGLQVEPDHSELHYNLGLSLIQKGMKSEGEKEKLQGIILRSQPKKEAADPHAFLKK